MDRTYEALDRLTLDLTSAPQTLYPLPGFQTDPHFISHPRDTAQPPPAQQQAPSASVQATLTDDALPEAPAEVPAVPARPETPTASVPAAPAGSRSPKARHRDEIDQYLWSVYQRSSTKRDSSGDFTWKDEAAAARLGLVTRQYVIGGMDPDFRELLYNLGHAMDADGLRWTILSGFRDDYRQGLASGYKARVGNSFHGGSRATGGYGHGCAADIEAVDGESDSAVWKFVDQHGERFGLFRPMKANDPAHIQPFGGWHDVALTLREKDAIQNAYLPASIDGADAGKPAITSLVETRSNVSEAQFDCVRSHGGRFRMAAHHAFPGRLHRAVMFHSGRMHRFGRRRMIVDVGVPGGHASVETPEKRASADAVQAASQMGAKAKAEASDKNRRDAGPHKVVDAGRPDKSQGREASRRAAPGADRTQHSAKGLEAKAAQKLADTRRAQKQVKAASQAKAKDRMADRQDKDASDRKL